jgi:hypothetical protein
MCPGACSPPLFERSAVCESTTVAGSGPPRSIVDDQQGAGSMEHGAWSRARPAVDRPPLPTPFGHGHGGSYAISVPLDERLPPPFQSLCCSASPFPALDTNTEAPAPGYRDGVVAQRHTQASHQPGLGLRQLSTGHACLRLGMEQSRQHGSSVHSISLRRRALCFGDLHSCVQSRSRCNCLSELAGHAFKMHCSSNLRSLQSNYSSTVPPVARAMVPLAMHPTSSLHRARPHAQFTPAVMVSN